MKQVLFEGVSYKVADWANWIARDNNGAVYAFEIKPTLVSRGTYWDNQDGGKILEVYPCPFQPSLLEIK